MIFDNKIVSDVLLSLLKLRFYDENDLDDYKN